MEKISCLTAGPESTLRTFVPVSSPAGLVVFPECGGPNWCPASSRTRNYNRLDVAMQTLAANFTSWHGSADLLATPEYVRHHHGSFSRLWSKKSEEKPCPAEPSLPHVPRMWRQCHQNSKHSSLLTAEGAATRACFLRVFATAAPKYKPPPQSHKTPNSKSSGQGNVGSGDGQQQQRCENLLHGRLCRILLLGVSGDLVAVHHGAYYVTAPTCPNSVVKNHPCRSHVP